MEFNFSAMNFEVIDINTNATPDIFINRNNITFSKRVLEDLNYPQNVQYCVDAAHKVFAIRVCKGSETKASSFSKPKAEQNHTLCLSNKNLRDIIVVMIPDYDAKKRYRVTGQYDAENRVMYYDMATAEKSNYRKSATDNE